MLSLTASLLSGVPGQAYAAAAPELAHGSVVEGKPRVGIFPYIEIRDDHFAAGQAGSATLVVEALTDLSSVTVTLSSTGRAEVRGRRQITLPAAKSGTPFKLKGGGRSVPFTARNGGAVATAKVKVGR